MFLRVLIVALLVWLLWRWLRRPRSQPTASTPRVQNMVRCAQCGVHVPEREAIHSAGRHYCCEQHRLADKA